MPISDCEVRDPRIRRTRQSLQAALRELLIAKNFDDISVQDITDTAAVNRATFYDHYNDKVALLEAMVAGGFHLLLHDRNVTFDGTCPSAASAVILATCDYLTQSNQTDGACQRASLLEPLSEAAITRAIGRVLEQGIPREQEEGMVPGILAATASWAIFGAVRQWYRTENRVPAEEMVGTVLKLILPILQTNRVPAKLHSRPSPEPVTQGDRV